MATSSRVRRGRETQRLVAEWFRRKGWPFAQPVGAFEQGRDLTGMPGLAPEVKGTSDGPLLKGLTQAAATCDGDLPFVVWRPDGYGPEKIERWVVAFYLDDATYLLQEAGYGNQPSGGESA